MNTETHQDSGERPCSEIDMARELFSAASVTMKMAKHIRKLESKIHKLERKMKIDSSSSDSDQDSDSGPSHNKQNIDNHSKDAKKHHASSDDPNSGEVQQKKKRKFQEEPAQTEVQEDSVCEERDDSVSLSDQNSSPQTKKFIKEVIQVRAPLVTITPVKKPLQMLETPQADVLSSSTTSKAKAKPGKPEEQQYLQEKGETYHYCCSYCNAYIRQLPNTLRGEHLIRCATKHLQPPPSPDQINTLIQKTKLQEVKGVTYKPTTHVVTAGEKQERPVTTGNVTTHQTAASADSVVNITGKRKSEESCTEEAKKVQVTALNSPTETLSISSTDWGMRKELDFTCEECGLVLSKSARLFHSQVCRKVISCLYCRKVFDSLDCLKKHKPQCKEVNWDQHPVRLLQYEKDVPTSVFSVSSPSVKTKEMEESGERDTADKDEYKNTSTNTHMVYDAARGERDCRLNSDAIKAKNLKGSMVKVVSKQDKLKRVTTGKNLQIESKIQRRIEQQLKNPQNEPRIHKRNEQKVKSKGPLTRKGQKQISSDFLKQEEQNCSELNVTDDNDKGTIPLTRHICMKCEKEFTARRFLVSHQNKCKKKVYDQDDQVKTDQLSTKETDALSKKKALVFHLCIKCDHQFISGKELREHQKNPMECEEWIKLKTRQKGLKTSSRFCSGCKTNFATQHDYMQHRTSCVNAKTDKSTHNCFQCYMSFDTKEGLTQHRQFAHSLNKSSNCWVCGETFSNFKEFLKHAEEHEDIKKRHPSRSRPCHVRDGHHLVLKKEDDPSILPPLAPEAIEAIANVMQGGQNKEATAGDGIYADRSPEEATISQGQLGNVLNPETLKSVKLNKHMDNSTKVVYTKNVSTQAKIVHQPESKLKEDVPSSFKSVSLLPNSMPISVASLQKSIAGKSNEKDMADKVTGLLHSLKSSKPTGETFQKLLSSHGINQSVQIKTNDPQLQKMISSLKSSPQIQLTGNRVGYILKACQTESGYQLLDPKSLPAGTSVTSIIAHTKPNEHLPSKGESDNLTDDPNDILKNLLLKTPHNCLVTQGGPQVPTSRKTNEATKKEQPKSERWSSDREGQTSVKEGSEDGQSHRENKVVTSGKRKTKAKKQFSTELGSDALETIVQATPVHQKSNREVVNNNPKSMTLTAQIIASSGSKTAESVIRKKEKKSPSSKGSRHKPSILTRKQQQAIRQKGVATRRTTGNNTGEAKVTNSSIPSVGNTETTPVQTIVPIGDNKVKCMYCGTIMTNIPEISSHKCSKTESDSPSSVVSKGKHGPKQGASLEQFSKLGILGTVQMIRNEDDPCGGEDDIDVEGDEGSEEEEEEEEREWAEEVLP